MPQDIEGVNGVIVTLNDKGFVERIAIPCPGLADMAPDERNVLMAKLKVLADQYLEAYRAARS